VLAAARAAWPTLAVPAEAFVAHLSERQPGPDEASASWHTSDLYLACALTRGEPAALTVFEARYMPIVEAAVTRMRLSRAKLDELKQTLRLQLLTAVPGARPKIAEYSGRGELGGWLRVAAVRAAVKLERRMTEILLEDETLAAVPALAPDPELAYARRAAQASFKSAFKEALATLPPVEQNVLRQHYLDRLSLDQIGALERVHRTTVARWLRDARRALLSRTRRLLMAKMRVSASECESLIRQARSRFDITLTSLLE
jgi:RNA polymerase sigma-70 factor (ECF subfamily)